MRDGSGEAGPVGTENCVIHVTLVIGNASRRKTGQFGAAYYDALVDAATFAPKRPASSPSLMFYAA